MRRRGVELAAAAVAALGFAFACGDVPTLPGGVAYITPILLPSPSMAFGDSLRDSTGKVAPLRVVAVARDSSIVTGVLVSYLLTSLNTGASVTNDGIVRAPDSLGTLRVVAQVTDGTSNGALQLQTPEVTIDVVPLADSMAQSGTLPATDSLLTLPLIQPLQVTVSGVGPSTRGAVSGIRVYYRIKAVYPASVPVIGHFYLADELGVLKRDSTQAIDTTSSAGIASRSLIGAASTDGSVVDSVLVEASASSQKGVPLTNSPVRFIVRVKHP